MKTQEEIEQLAEQYWDKQPYNEDAYVVGYTQCQEDMADKKYTELQLRFFADELIKGIEEKNKQGYEDIKVDYESLILSLNKQFQMTEPIDTNKYQVWFQDTDPDTGEICQTKLICIAINKTMANWIVSSLERTNGEIGEPNRDFIMAIDYPLQS